MRTLLLVCTLALVRHAPAQDLYWYMSNGKFGYINQEGTTIIPPRFIYAGSFSEGLAVAAEGTQFIGAKYGFINTQGKWVIQPQFEAADLFSEGKARVQLHGKWGYIKKDGSWSITPQFSLCYEFRGGMAEASLKNFQWGLIDTTGKFIVSPDYFSLTQPSNNYYTALTTPQSRWQICSVKPAACRETPYARMNHFSEGLAAARNEDDLWGFVNTKGQWIIEPVFTNAAAFAEGLAAVEKNHATWGFINIRGEWVIEPRYDRHGFFNKGLALMEQGAQVVYINKTGKTIYSFAR